MNYKKMIIELLDKVEREYTLKRTYRLLEYLYLMEDEEMDRIKVKILRDEKKNMVTKIPVTVRTEILRPERKFEVKIKKDAPLKPQEQSKIFIKNMDEYEAMLYKAKQELYKFKERYATFPELQKIFDAIDKI